MLVDERADQSKLGDRPNCWYTGAPELTCSRTLVYVRSYRFAIVQLSYSPGSHDGMALGHRLIPSLNGLEISVLHREPCKSLEAGQ